MAYQAVETSSVLDRKHPVPPRADDRERLRQLAGTMVARLDSADAPSLGTLAGAGRNWLESLGLPTDWLGFAMVCLNNAYWADAFAAVDPRRRLLLLPHCLIEPERCQATVNAAGLHCHDCGACNISALRTEALSLGYQVVVAEGTGQLLDRLTSGMADAILGVACMESLGKSYPRLVELGVPNLAVPLLADGCRNTQTDIDHLLSLMRMHDGRRQHSTRTYLPLLRQTRLMFEAPLFDSLLEGIAPSGAALSPILGETDRVALAYLRHGGKRLRPFASLAAFAVGKAGDAALSPEASPASLLTSAHQRIAMAIEAMHQASLVHDDIEDHDDFRHGRLTLHRQYGVPTAINLGDHLIGLGYRLVAGESAQLGAQTVADMLGVLARSHMELTRGQGAELFWQERPGEPCTPADVLRLYALKTSPAFESALYCGMRMAETAFDAGALQSYCTYLGSAFQIANDLDDWKADESSKRLRGRDALEGRPTVLHALAMESAGADEIRRLQLKKDAAQPHSWLAEMEAAYHENGVFDRTRQLLQKMVERAHDQATLVAQPALARLLQSLVRLSVPAESYRT